MRFTIRKQPQDYLTDQRYLSGLLTGLVAGLAAGFLFAPRSGKETRSQIAGAVTDQTKEVKNQWDKTKDQAREAIEHIKTNVGITTSKAEDELETLSNKAQDKAKQFAEDAKSGIDKAKNALT
ncbi:YtxH domain-containing protein [Spirosoma pollinicola]|uniref:YtxH domain-containing protein n=1 Tax=Spirosoma pollinicola TaxID=2057025 RepID=A0A2K8YZD1_9BACT|nr:YtxH domain-containing protein [Spirosoma pollinicola]AUD02908.1 hypothetical protein CWM47_14335 [Spirosoma pollinicola]